MTIVVLSDGREIDVPDNAPPEHIAAVKAKVREFEAGRPSGKPAGGGFLDTAVESVKDLGRGALRGVAGLVEGAANASQGAQLADMLGLPGADKMKPAAPTEAVNAALPTPPGQSFRRAALEGIGGGLTTGLNPVNLVSGAAAGLAGEAADRYAPNNPLAKFGASFAGGLAGGLGAGLATRSRPQNVSIAKELTEGFTEADLKAGQAYQRSAAEQGHQIDFAQAMQAATGRAGNLGGFRDYLANRSQGNAVQEVLRNQPTSLHHEANLTATSLPGKGYGYMQSANNLQETATKAIQSAKGARSALWEKTLDDGINAGGGKVVPFSALSSMQVKLGQLADVYPNTKQAEILKDLQQKLMTPEGYINDPKAVNEIFKEFTNKLKSPTLRDSGVDAGMSKYLGSVITGLREDLGASFAPVRSANAAYKDFTESVIAPLKQGPVGRVAGRGFVSDVQAPDEAFQRLMNKGTVPGSSNSELRTLTRELAKVDPSAVEDSLRNHLNTLIGKAGNTPARNGMAPSNNDLPNRLETALFKDPLQYQGLKDVVAELAIARGKKPEEVLRGVENLRQLTAAMANRPAKLDGLSPADISGLGKKSVVADAVRVFSLLPFNRVGEAIERSTLGETLRQFDKILTSPEHVDKLIELGKTPIMSKKAQAILGTWGGMVGNSDGLSNNNPPE